MDGRVWLEDVRQVFEKQQDLAERALVQVGDGDFFRQADEVSNSCAVIVKHIAGNMRSRWTDFLTTDGEKPDRDRDGEFEIREGDSRESLERALAEGWRRLGTALDSIDPDDLGRRIMIRGEALTVMQAVHRQVSHYAYHIGQLVHVARALAGPSWKSLSIPKGESRTFNLAPDKYLGGTRTDR
jgi:hypothetical protein